VARAEQLLIWLADDIVSAAQYAGVPLNATLNMLSLGIVPVVGLLGGTLSETIGPSPTLVVAPMGELVSITWLLFSPARRIRQMGRP